MPLVIPATENKACFYVHSVTLSSAHFYLGFFVIIHYCIDPSMWIAFYRPTVFPLSFFILTTTMWNKLEWESVIDPKSPNEFHDSLGIWTWHEPYQIGTPQEGGERQQPADLGSHGRTHGWGVPPNQPTKWWVSATVGAFRGLWPPRKGTRI